MKLILSHFISLKHTV